MDGCYRLLAGQASESALVAVSDVSGNAAGSGDGSMADIKQSDHLTFRSCTILAVLEVFVF